MDGAAEPPRTVEELLSSLTEVVAQTFSATSHIRRNDIVDEVETGDSRRATAAFSLEDGRLQVCREDAALLQRFLDGALDDGSGRSRARSVLLELIHENIHSLGPAATAEMEAEWRSRIRRPHGHTLSEGLAQLGAERRLAQIAGAVGISALGSLPPHSRPEDEIYPAQRAAVEALLSRSAAIRGASFDAVLGGMIALGAGDTALKRLVGSMTNSRVARAWCVHAAIAPRFAEIADEWSLGFPRQPDPQAFGRRMGEAAATEMAGVISLSNHGQARRIVRHLGGHARVRTEDAAIAARSTVGRVVARGPGRVGGRRFPGD
jgi:hypothetical protein